jgi:hypothetical protein
LDSELSSDVKAGENGGRHLNHDFAALALMKQPLTEKDGEIQGEFTIDSKASAFYCYLCGGLSAGAAVAAWFMLPSPFLIYFTGACALVLFAAGFWYGRGAKSPKKTISNSSTTPPHILHRVKHVTPGIE